LAGSGCHHQHEPATERGAPCSSRFKHDVKNVLTGGIASSNCGGQFGVMLKRAGYDGIILKAKAQNPARWPIVDGKATVSDAGDLWGKDAEETQHAFPKVYGKLVIGPAGEHLVRYAAAVSGERVAGRCGAGAVLGAKKIKAIVAYGTQPPEVCHREKFAKYVKKWVHFLRNHPMTGESLPNYGSADSSARRNRPMRCPRITLNTHSGSERRQRRNACG
jgi:aldehyde:ferredoxin oxidoreductase